MTTVTHLPPDGFPFASGAPLADIQHLVSAYLAEIGPVPQRPDSPLWSLHTKAYNTKAQGWEAGRLLLSGNPESQVRVVEAAVERLAWMWRQYRVRLRLSWRSRGRQLPTVDRQMQDMEAASSRAFVYGRMLGQLLHALLSRRLPYAPDSLHFILRKVVWAAKTSGNLRGFCALGSCFANNIPAKPLLSTVERHAAAHGLSPEIEFCLRRLDAMMRPLEWAGARQVRLRIAQIAQETQQPEPGEPWADTALTALAAMPPAARAAWGAVFAHAATAEGGKPGAQWLAEADRRRRAVGAADFNRNVASWLNMTAPPPAFDKTPPDPPDADPFAESQAYADYQKASQEYQRAFCEYRNSISDKNITLLKGLAWYAGPVEDTELAWGLGHMAEAAYQIAEVAYQRTGWAARAGNAAIWALGLMPGGVGVGPLARLRTRLRDRGALKLIAASIEAAAQSAGMTVDELEDLAVPTGGLGADGTRRETFGKANADEGFSAPVALMKG